MPKIHLATISVLVKDRHSQAPDINQILTDHGRIILARLGLNLQPKCIEHCSALITLICQGSAEEISALAKELDGIYGIIAKHNLLTE